MMLALAGDRIAGVTRFLDNSLLAASACQGPCPTTARATRGHHRPTDRPNPHPIRAAFRGGSRGAKVSLKKRLPDADRAKNCGSGMDYRGVDLRVVVADVLSYSSDLLVLKHAGALYGADDLVVRATKINPIALPATGRELLVSHPAAISYQYLLFIGVDSIRQFGYDSIRGFSRRALTAAAKIEPSVREISMTLHGIGFGLDETAAFESEIAGIAEAIDSGDCPSALETISFIERNSSRADRMRNLLSDLLRSAELGAPSVPSTRGGFSREELQSERINAAGVDSASRSHAFVAMSFNKTFEDVFEFGIKPSVNAAGLNCHRMDQISFTGDIVALMRERIASAKIVVADLTDSNPNVYLEIGYAWGVKVPCVLVCNRENAPKFDLRGQRCLFYDNIKQLNETLSGELRNLLPAG
jgi:hypothetical protein